MKETGIIMSGNHPKLILDDLKTMTRRVMKPQPPVLTDGYSWRIANGGLCAYKFHPEDLEVNAAEEYIPYCKCPYGQVGDRLWVRETWATENRYNHLKPSEIPQTATIYYYLAGINYDPFEMGIKRPSIFMPRWASRITLEITEVRVERVQDITKDDCLAEGIETLVFGAMINYRVGNVGFDSPQIAFQVLWDSLNAKRGYGWEVNPWCWVISFKKV